MAMEHQKIFTIGQLAKAARVNPQTLRFYERKGILKPANRLQSRYRIYNRESLKRLRFIKQAQGMGFTLDEIQSLLNLRVRSVQRCDQVRTKAEMKLRDVRSRIAQLKRLEQTLAKLVSDCESRVVSDCCPIIDKMETEES